MFDGTRATGVVFRHEGVPTTVRAAREVILCGGAINSPQLLMLSGVGPARSTGGAGDSGGASPRRASGKACRTITRRRSSCGARQPITLNDVVNSKFGKVKAGLQYLMFRTGALTMGVSPAADFIRTRPELASPDVKCSISPFSADRPQDGLHKWPGFTMIAYQLRPDSRGEIWLKTASPADAPAMIPNYLSAEVDQRAIVAGLQWCRRVLAQPAMQRFRRVRVSAGSLVQTDDEWLDHARQPAERCFTRPAPARWAAIRWRWSTRNCACMG